MKFRMPTSAALYASELWDMDHAICRAFRASDDACIEHTPKHSQVSLTQAQVAEVLDVITIELQHLDHPPRRRSLIFVHEILSKTSK